MAGSDDPDEREELKSWIEGNKHALKTGVYPPDHPTVLYQGYRAERAEAEGFSVGARVVLTDAERRALLQIPFEAFDPQFPNQPLEQSRFRHITLEHQAATNRAGEIDLPMEGARLAPADPNAAPVGQTNTEESLTGLADILPPDEIMQLLVQARERGEKLNEREEAFLLIWDAKQQNTLNTLLGLE